MTDGMPFIVVGASVVHDGSFTVSLKAVFSKPITTVQLSNMILAFNAQSTGDKKSVFVDILPRSIVMRIS
eukprot:3444798-Ditylum_brightwellii.AAC.2